MSPLSFTTVRLTRHAREKMAARGVEPEALADVIRKLSVVEPHGSAWRVTRGPLSVVAAVDGSALVVISVLLRSTAKWTDRDVRAAIAGGVA